MSPNSATASATSVCEWCGLKNHGHAFRLDARFPEWQIQWEDQKFKGSQCPWLRRINCKYGFICNSGGSERLLWACATKIRQAKMLTALAGSDQRFTLRQTGDTEAAVEFGIDDFEIIVPILQPVRR